MSVEVSAAVEEYLEVIFKLEEKAGSARTSDIAEQLKVALGTVTNTIESLETLRLVVHRPYRGVNLTRRGRRLALNVIRRHRLSERLLTDILRFDWGRAHEAACRLERLGRPNTCPHGNPIPDELGKIAEDRSQPLSDLDTSEGGTIVKISSENTKMLQYLAATGLVPGEKVEVERKAPFVGRLMVKVKGRRYAIDSHIASAIWVRKMEQ